MRILQKFSYSIIVPAVLISFLSLFTLYSLDSSLASKQLMFILVGILLFILFSFFDVSILTFLFNYLWLFSNAILIFTLVFGKVIKGSSRWVDFFGFRFQPSELVKIIYIILLATYFSKVSKSNLGVFLKSIMLFFPTIILVFLQPDLGTSLVFCFIFFNLLIFSKMSKWYILILVILLGLVSSPVWNNLKDYQKNRLMVFINPYSDPLGSGYNVIQSKIAIGSGKVFGKGFGQGTQSHLKFLPEYHTDFIFASFAEEWGFFGVSLLLVLYFIFTAGLIRAMGNSEGLIFFVLLGIFSMFIFQIFVNVGMNLGIMPVTGIPLPLMSYGGTSVLISYISIGIVNGINMRVKG